MLVATILSFCGLALAAYKPTPSSGVPSLKVPACPAKATASWNTAMPTPSAFPRTHVDLCYDSSNIHLTFNALDEIHYFYNESYKTNDNIFEYEVMETFIYHGTNDPSTYLEFEIAPNNVTFNAWIYNPSKVRTAGYPFNGAYIRDAIEDGIVAQTTLNRPKHTWVSDVKIPLAHFSVDEPKGSKWRMNFFRTVVDPKTFPNQTLGAWSPNGEPNFHNSPKFGHIEFV